MEVWPSIIHNAKVGDLAVDICNAQAEKFFAVEMGDDNVYAGQDFPKISSHQDI